MAAVENGSTISVEDDAKYGFQREEMFSANISNTVDAYDRHVFLCYKGPEAWPSRVEASDTDLLPKLLSAAVKARKDDITVKTKLTVCGGCCDGEECSDGTVLIFPEMTKYKGLTEANVDQFVDDVLVNGKPWASGEQEAITSSYVFVCAHGSRDKRCGVCGPPLIESFKSEIESRGMNGQVVVSPCSHIGGHKYAGNVIIYSPDAEGKILGHWYGYVSPEDVPELMTEQIVNGRAVERLWRGQMGAAPVEGEDAKDKKEGKKDKKDKKKKHHETATTEVVKEATANNTGGCCQGPNGFSCCKEASPEETKTKETPNKAAVSCKLPSWVGKWEQHELYTAAAVVGAVATVAVGYYSFYKRSHSNH